MNLITIARDYGAGGGELAQRLADALGWELLGKELLHQAADIEHVPDAELQQLDEKAVTMADRFRLHPHHQKYLEGLTQAVEQAAARGRTILLGRGAAHLLAGKADCLHVRLVASKAWRAERMALRRGGSIEKALACCAETDRVRQRFTRYFFGQEADAASRFDLIFNSERAPFEDIAATIVAVIENSPIRVPNASDGESSAMVHRRVLTLSRELGAGDQGFAPTLAECLNLRVYDRELLEEEAARLGVPATAIEKIDEMPAGVFSRWRPGGLQARYVETLQGLMREIAERGDAMLVGRGGRWFLRDHPTAFHARLMASTPVRVRRVMEYRWVRESVAKRLIARSDARRKGFCMGCFGADWSSPAEYDLTVNSGRLGPMAVDVVAMAASRHWNRSRP
jgi:cytidylate kinase